MNRRAFLQTASLGAAGALAATPQQSSVPPAGHFTPEAPDAQHPNVIWLFGDQFRAQALSFNGDPNSLLTSNAPRSTVSTSQVTYPDFRSAAHFEVRF
jgi:hypothetical protein